MKYIIQPVDARTFKVWNVERQIVEHIGTESSCREWIRNVEYMGF